MRRVLKVFGVILLLLLASIAIVAALNFTYLKRTFGNSDVDQVREVYQYQPKVVMQPAGTAETLARSEDLALQEIRFAEAISYAEEINSSAFLIYQGGELLVEKYWEPYDATSYTQTQSIHKSLLSLAVGVAIEEGHIGSVDDPVSSYLGEWTDQSLGQIQIKHLLNMSSGLGKEPAKFFLFSHFLRLLNSTDISQVAQSLPQKKTPGEEFEYINSNPQLLVDVLESATDQSYESYLDEKIWSRMAANPGYLWMDREDGTPRGYCCLIALPEDLLRIGLLVLNKGQINGEQIVPASWIDQATAPSELNSNYGYLMWRGSPHTSFRKYSASSEFGVVHSEPYLADDLIYFDGFGGQRVYIVPSQGLVIVRVGETRFDFDDAILPNLVLEVLDTELAETVGYFDTSIETDHSGSVDVRISYPLHAGAQTHPLILFSHGHYLTNKDYHNLTDEWVRNGYIVAAPLHLDTGDMQEVQALGEQLGSDWISAARALDMIAVLNQIDSVLAEIDGFGGRVATDQIVAAGHSYGALTAQIMAGAVQRRLGNSAYTIPETLSDERVKAVVAVSPPGLVDGYIEAATWETLGKPQLIVTGTRDVFEHVWQDYRAHLVSYESAPPGDNYLLVLEGVDHYFGNLIGRLDRSELPQQAALENVVERSLVFMESYLNGNTGESENLRENLDNFSEIRAREAVMRYEKR